jgi:hypothetical protein
MMSATCDVGHPDVSLADGIARLYPAKPSQPAHRGGEKRVFISSSDLVPPSALTWREFVFERGTQSQGVDAG